MNKKIRLALYVLAISVFALSAVQALDSKESGKVLIALMGDHPGG